MNLIIFDPQVANLSAKVDAISNMGKEGVRVAGGAQSEVGSVGHCIVLDVLWEQPTSLQENSTNKSLRAQCFSNATYIQNILKQKQTVPLRHNRKSIFAGDTMIITAF